jgi:MYXO-CTERM domain-containing protein
MRKTIAVICATGALTVGGAGIANATVQSAPVPSSTTTTTLADDNDNTNQNDSDKSGLWGLAGLLGLVGLAGLKRRKDTDVAAVPAARGPNTPRV